MSVLVCSVMSRSYLSTLMLVKWTRQAGFSQIEFPFVEMTSQEEKRLPTLLSSLGASVYSVHAPKQLFSLSTAQCMTQLQATIQFARNLGAKVIVAHPDTQNVRLIARPLHSLQKDFPGLILAFENTTPQVTHWIQQLRDVLPCGLALDCSHAQYLQTAFDEYFRLPVVHIHLRGYSPTSHYQRMHPTDNGIAALLAVCKAHGYSGAYTLEYPYNSPGDIVQDRTIVVNLLQSAGIDPS